MPATQTNKLPAGAAIYNKLVLSMYDQYVLGFSNRFVWQCPTARILEFYNQHITAHHLEVGVGTGYFLDHCRFPTPNPALTLVDLNSNSLQVSARRLGRYQPRTLQVDLLQPLEFESEPFTSIGLNYVLHCLPGNLRQKGHVLRQLKSRLDAGGKIFGATLLGTGVPLNWLARAHLRLYNTLGIFSNHTDRLTDLQAVLHENFRTVTVQGVGCAALFVAGI